MLQLRLLQPFFPAVWTLLECVRECCVVPRQPETSVVMGRQAHCALQQGSLKHSPHTACLENGTLT